MEESLTQQIVQAHIDNYRKAEAYWKERTASMKNRPAMDGDDQIVRQYNGAIASERAKVEAIVALAKDLQVTVKEQ